MMVAHLLSTEIWLHIVYLYKYLKLNIDYVEHVLIEISFLKVCGKYLIINII